MRFWIVAAAEPLPMLDGSFREFRCSLLAKALVARGHDVTWWTSDHDHMRKTQRYGHFKSIELSPRLRLKLLPGPRYERNVSLRRLWHNRVVARRFLAQARRCPSPPELVFACLPTLELAQSAVTYAHELNVRVVVDVRDKWPDIYLGVFPRIARPAARAALASEFRRASDTLGAAHAITAVSESYLTWALQHAGRRRRDNDRVFPLGFDAPADVSLPESPPHRSGPDIAKSNRSANGSLTVTFVGTFGASYDLETVLEAAEKCLATMNGRVQFLLIGDGDKAASLRRRAKSLTNVTFTGWLDAPEMSRRLEETDIGLAAYGMNAQQSLPNKLFEYMAAGVPLLSSLRGEQESLIKENHIGLHYEPHSSASLIDRLAWFQANPAERLAMGARARRLFDRSYRADTVYGSLVDHLETIVAGSN